MSGASWVEFVIGWFPIFLFAIIVLYIARSDFMIKKRMKRIDISVAEQREILETLREIRDILKKERT